MENAEKSIKETNSSTSVPSILNKAFCASFNDFVFANQDLYKEEIAKADADKKATRVFPKKIKKKNNFYTILFLKIKLLLLFKKLYFKFYQILSILFEIFSKFKKEVFSAPVFQIKIKPFSFVFKFPSLMEINFQDFLGWSTDKEILKVIGEENIYFSNKVYKFNNLKMKQERNLVLTDRGIYNFHNNKIR